MNIPRIRVGDPVRHGGLSVFPLFTGEESALDYRLSDEVMDSRDVVVEEIGDQGSVPEISVENTGDSRVLFLEGEQLVGAKQNRILNVSLLVAGHTKIKVPVSCVEQGRWRRTSSRFSSSKTGAPSSLRHRSGGRPGRAGAPRVS